MTARKLTPEEIKTRLGKSDALEESVHRVIAAFIANLGGRVIVSGPIEIQSWPGDRKDRFRVALKCTGRKPILADAARRLK